MLYYLSAEAVRAVYRAAHNRTVYLCVKMRIMVDIPENALQSYLMTFIINTYLLYLVKYT